MTILSVFRQKKLDLQKLNYFALKTVNKLITKVRLELEDTVSLNEFQSPQEHFLRYGRAFSLSKDRSLLSVGVSLHETGAHYTE